MDISESVILDIESLTLPPNKCSGSPKMTKALSRKGSYRMERRNGEEQEGDDTTKKLLAKVVCSQLEQSKQPFVPNKAIAAAPIMANCTNLADAGEGRIKRFNRLMTINPRRILLLFASMSSMGTMILIYFTLAIYRRSASES
ncbi:hypothetical protein KFK09_009721 [Dendrobium nobile]|uniref:Uncharacterized protein n=1 Tax=Dendrobium nobile TaxID=94219 RepID=A0A8T3BKA1_DENNO|nr:hypothetical protein KFK09_009721 [Dendrobium nobile]